MTNTAGSRIRKRLPAYRKETTGIYSCQSQHSFQDGGVIWRLSARAGEVTQGNPTIETPFSPLLLPRPFFFCKVFKGYFPLPPLALSRRYWKAKSSGFFYSVLPKSIESRICHHLSFLLNVITAWHIKPNTREKQPPPNSDAPHPAPDIVIKPPTKKIPMPRNIPTP